MNGYLSRSACRGRRPSSLVATELRHRPLLVGKLLKERGVARFIVGPSGYGKTFLAMEYAEVVFEWSHVFWVNAQSPCFIRSLDDCSLANECLAVDARASLVVFDDLPPLSAERMKTFSDQIDLLIEQKCEVIVCCVPTSDMVGSLQHDRIRIGARDLLLDDLELDEARPLDERKRTPALLMGASERIPMLVWQSELDAPARFARGLFNEELPADVLLLLGSTLVIQRGTVSCLEAEGLLNVSAFADVAEDYPHFGFAEGEEGFLAPVIGVDALALSLKRHLPEMARRASFDSPSELVRAWAAILMQSGRATRACDLVRLVYPSGLRARWLFDNAWELVRQASFFPAYQLAQGQERRCKGADKLRLNAIEGLCLRMLGDEDGSVHHAKRAAFNSATPLEAKVCGLLVVARSGSTALGERAVEALEQGTAEGQFGDTGSDSPWAFLASAWLECRSNVVDFAMRWQELEERCASADVLCLCASWLFSLLDAGKDGLAALIDPRMSACERFVRARLVGDDEAVPNYFAASAGLAMEEAHLRGMQYEGGPLPTRALISLRQTELDIMTQRNDYLQFKQAGAQQGAGSALSALDASLRLERLSSVAVRQRNVPTLTLHLFGRLGISIGNEPIPDSQFRRRNARTLLALLALNHGREMPREHLAHALWPEKPQELARKSYYTVWSQLRQALRLPDGTCPYLLRHQYGCSLEMRYVVCDVERFEELCRELQFGIPDHERWSQLFAELDRDFSNELLPFEDRNEYIMRARKEYRVRLVDALVSATVSITQTEDPHWGIWFARSAIAHDDTREDAYAALMRAQIASDQRTSAMMTYLACRQVLSKRLGIDPSAELTKLYESLLDES